MMPSRMATQDALCMAHEMAGALVDGDQQRCRRHRNGHHPVTGLSKVTVLPRWSVMLMVPPAAPDTGGRGRRRRAGGPQPARRAAEPPATKT